MGFATRTCIVPEMNGVSPITQLFPGMMLILLYLITNIRFVFCFYSTVLRSLIIVASNISGFCWMMFWWGVILIHTNWNDILEASIWVVEWWRPSNEIVDENYLLFLLIFVIIIIFLFKVCMDFYQRKKKVCIVEFLAC